MENDQNGGRNTPIIVLAVIMVIFALIIFWRARYSHPAPGLEPNKSPSPALQSSEPVSINELIRVRTAWDPVFENYYGKPAPDFNSADINSNPVRLSSYKNKSPVMIVFWATWCPPCRKEIPVLIELRSQIKNEQLGLLAISNEDPAIVKQFAAKNSINYTVLALPETTFSEPFNSVEYLPTTIFIDKNGLIRLACTGTMTKKEISLALKALESPSSTPSEPNSAIRL